MLHFRRKYKVIHISYCFIALIVISLTACSSQQKLDKEILKLNQGRAWPHNYTFLEYCEHLDEAEKKKVLLATRKKQAKEKKEERTLDVLNKTSQQNEKNINRLKKDKDFYKVYKLRVRQENKPIADEDLETSQIVNEHKEQIKSENKKQIKARKKHEKEMYAKRQKSNKERQKSIKEREERTDAKLQDLRDKREAIANKDVVVNKDISTKEKEIAKLLKEQSKAPEEDKEYYDDEINFIREEIVSINEQKGDTQNSLDSMDLVIERFIELHYTTDSTSTEAKPALNAPLP